MERKIIFQATRTIANGLAWDFSEGMMTHILESSSKTMCGKSCAGGSSYGWRDKGVDKKISEVCPVCQKMDKVSSKH